MLHVSCFCIYVDIVLNNILKELGSWARWCFLHTSEESMSIFHFCNILWTSSASLHRRVVRAKFSAQRSCGCTRETYGRDRILRCRLASHPCFTKRSPATSKGRGKSVCRRSNRSMWGSKGENVGMACDIPDEPAWAKNIIRCHMLWDKLLRKETSEESHEA